MQSKAYSPSQKERLARERLEESSDYPDEFCTSDDGHDFVSLSTLEDEQGKLFGRFMCSYCRKDVTVQFYLSDVDEKPEGWNGTPIDEMMNGDA